MIRWPWSKPKPETRSVGGFTGAAMLARADVITGARGAAELTAAVQACVSLWENGLSLADVDGAPMLTPRTLALIARSLALRGEFVALIDGDRLTPAADWDVTTARTAPRAYRLSLPDTGGGRTLTALAPEVAHIVIGADAREPWRGTAPLRRASLTGDMLATVEAALGEVFANAPLGSQVVPMPETPGVDLERLAAGFRGQRGRVLLRESVTTTAAGGPVPQTDWKPAGMTMNLRDAMALEALERAQAAILAAYGVDPSFLSATANGGGLREAQRHLATWTLQPVAALIAEELTAKTGAPVALDVLRALQAYDAGGRARAAGAIVRALIEAKEAGLDPATIARAFGRVDWEV